MLMLKQNGFGHELASLLETIKNNGVTDERVLRAMSNVPRHLFVPAHLYVEAYFDCALPIGDGQTISQPTVVGLMTQHLKLKPEDKILEVGTGSGYQSAILSNLAKEVYSIERIPALATNAKRVLHSIGLTNVHIFLGDGSKGLAEYAPYNAIMVTAAAKEVPSALIHQLQEGGRIVMPVGEPFSGQILKIGVKHSNTIHWLNSEPVMFVPLIKD